MTRSRSQEDTSRMMRGIKNKGSQIETVLQKALWHRGLRYRKNAKGVLGKPDIAFVGRKIAVFCDSEFWHGFDWEHRQGDIKVHQDFWIPKIERNMARDKEVTDRLTADGWIVLRYWGKDILKNTSQIADEIERVYRERTPKK